MLCLRSLSGGQGSLLCAQPLRPAAATQSEEILRLNKVPEAESTGYLFEMYLIFLCDL